MAAFKKEEEFMLIGTAKVCAWVTIDQDCPIQAEVNGERDFEFQVGGQSDGFELVFEHEALERFVRVADDIMAGSPPEAPNAQMAQLAGRDQNERSGTSSEDRSSEAGPLRKRFFLTHKNKTTEIYGLGTVTATEAQIVWLNPRTGIPEFGTFDTLADMLAHVQAQLRLWGPLAVQVDERPVGPDLARIHDQVVLTKVARRQ